MLMTPRFVEFEDSAVMAAALADEIAQRLTRAVGERGVASLVVSGGGTPRPVFKALSGRPLAWDRVVVTLADERWVDPRAAESNERLVRRTLLTGHAAAARFVPLKTDHLMPETGEAACNAALGDIARPFDVVLLGMGDDGHTASLFPGAAELTAALDPATARSACAVRPARYPAAAPYPRMSLTLAALLDSAWIVLLIAGAGKKTVYDQALAGEDTDHMPVRAVLHQTRVPIDVYWAP